MFNPQSHFQMPYGMELPREDSYASTHSSFPSGHAAVVSLISLGITCVSWPVGVLALAYALFICTLRVFFGYHYATEICAGVVIGVAALCLAMSQFRVVCRIRRKLLRWSVDRPGLFYPIVYLFTLEIITGFAEAKMLIHLLRYGGAAQ